MILPKQRKGHSGQENVHLKRGKEKGKILQSHQIIQKGEKISRKLEKGSQEKACSAGIPMGRKKAD